MPAMNASDAEEIERLKERRNSPWPFLLDTGVVAALFGLIIVRQIVEIAGQVLIVGGVMLAIAALFMWLRDARTDYTKLSE